MNGFRALLIVAVVACALIMSMTIITINGSTIPNSYDEALIFLVGSVAGAGAVKAGNGIARNGSP